VTTSTGESEGDGDTTSAVAQWSVAKRAVHINGEAGKRAVRFDGEAAIRAVRFDGAANIGAAKRAVRARIIGVDASIARAWA